MILESKKVILADVAVEWYFSAPERIDIPLYITSKWGIGGRVNSLS